MRYAEEFCANHLEKIFYFCLRKTGGEQQAEELTSDISYEVRLSLSRGATPRSLSAWVWRIAKNGIVWHGGWQSAEDMKRTLLMRAVDLAEYEAGDEFLPKQKLPRTKRADGGERDVVGYEKCPDPRRTLGVYIVID